MKINVSHSSHNYQRIIIMTAFVRTGNVRLAKTVFNITSEVVWESFEFQANGPKLETKNRN